MQESDFLPYRAHSSIAPGKTLVFAPHPDDEVLGCGGAIIRHVRQGDAVRVVIITNGAFPDRAYIAGIREQESRRAAEILHYGEPVFLDYPDRGLRPDENLIARLLQIIEDFAPHNIYLPAGTEIHPDHRAAHAAGLEAAKRYAPDVALFFYEIGHPLQPNFLHNITDIQPVLEEAMDCFSSQTASQDYKRHITALHAYRTYTLGRHVKFAEAYTIIRSLKLKSVDVIWQQTPGFKRQAEAQGRSDETCPLVSVIVRTMNRPELVEALQSIAEQTYPNLEVIVVDASGHNSLNLGQHCGEFPLRLVSKNKVLNRPQASNAGLAAVRGKYFGFLDEDDLLLPGHFSHLVRALSSGTAPAVYDIVEQVDKTMACECRYAKKFDYMSLLWGNYIPNMAVLFDAAILRKGCAFDTDFFCYEDWDFLLQAARLGDFVFVPEKGGIYRNFGNSGIQDDPYTISQYRKKLYLKWIPNIPDGKLLSLAHNSCDFPAGTRPFVPEGEQAEPGTPTPSGRLCPILAKPLRIIKKIYQLTMDRGLIKRSGLFDEQYYLHHNPDVKTAGMDPAKHYLLFGAFEGRNPSERFDTLLYRYQNPEVVTFGINPLIHYLKCSRRSG